MRTVALENSQTPFERATRTRLSVWSRANALVMLASAVGALEGLPHLLVCAAGVTSFSALVFAFKGAYTPRGGFGAANTVSLARLFLLCGLGWSTAGGRSPGPIDALVLALVFTLDGLDGRLARTRGTCSAFGAHLDMEVDAFGVLLVSLVLWLGGRADGFVLIPGVLRYAYVLLLWALNLEGREAPPSALGRHAFSLMMVALFTGLWPAETIYRPLLHVASATIVISFARSLMWSLSHAQTARG